MTSAIQLSQGAGSLICPTALRLIHSSFSRASRMALMVFSIRSELSSRSPWLLTLLFLFGALERVASQFSDVRE